MNHTDIQNKEQAILIKIACFFWFLGKWITYKSWIAERDLPTVGIFRFLDTFPTEVHSIAFFTSMIFLVLIICKPLKSIIGIFIIVEIFSVLLDVLRLQVWEYLYIFIFSLYFIFRDRPAIFYKSLLLVMASTYIFSGLHKFGGAFLNTVWDNYFLKDIFGLTYKHVPKWLHYAGLLFGVGEFLGGLLLLVTKNKKTAVMALISMHIFIFIVTGLIKGQPLNSIIPWNILMVVFLFYILRYTSTIDKNSISIVPMPAMAVLVVFWYLLPFTNLFGFWEHHLSSGMYTGKPPKVYICWNDHGKGYINSAYFLKKDKYNICNNGRVILLSKWTHLQSTQAPFTAVWYYERLIERLKQKYPDDGIQMFYTQYPYRDVKEIR